MVGLFVLVALGAASQTRDHPATKIIALLQKLQAQVKEEGEAETASYAKFQTWCTDLTTAKKKAIAAANDQIAKDETSIEALSADIETLEADIATITTEISTDEAGKATADQQRESANGEYLTTKSDLEGTITAVETAITSLEGSDQSFTQVQKNAVKQALAFVDIYAPEAASKKVHAFLQQREEPMTAATSTSRAQGGGERTYDFKSGGVIEILKQLKTKFEDELEEAKKAETAADSAWKLADAAAQDEIDAATTAKGKKEILEGDKGQQKATDTTTLNEATSAKTGASTVLSDTEATCRTRASEFEDRMKTRAGETEAMDQAIEILGKAVHTRTKGDQFSLAQTVSFLQKSNDPRTKIVNLLRKAGKKDLTKLADAIAKTEEQPLGSGTFDQIKNMIQKMIFHLMSEQKDEDDHKNWCDTEIAKTNKMKDDKETTENALTADINSLTAEIDQLGRDIASNEQDIADENADIEAETASRNEAKAENAATVKDAEDAEKAVADAIAVLTDFYKESGAVQKEAWEAFTQLKTARRVSEEPDAPEPELWGDEPKYTNVGSGTDSGPQVIEMLKDIGEDFAQMGSQAKADETTQQDNHDTFLTATHANIAELTQDTEMKKARKETQSAKLESKQADFKNNEKELEATNQYLTDLEPACVGKAEDSTYDDRKAARTAEIEALKQAQDILEHAFDETEEK